LANTPITKRELPQLDQLVSQYVAQLQPEDWEVVGFAYWGKPVYPCWGCLCQSARTPLLPHWLRIPTKKIASARSLSTAGAQLPDAKETGTSQLANTAKTKDA